jgi:hypothetical protein
MFGERRTSVNAVKAEVHPASLPLSTFDDTRRDNVAIAEHC